MDKTLPEAHAVAFTNFKRTDGFEVSITLRGDTGTEVLERLGKAIEQIKLDGGEPVSRSFGSKSAPVSSATKLCTEHQTDMKEKVSKKTGKAYFSHSKQDESGTWLTCFGKGWQSF